jgi:starch-binding outer membrane protein, SusD/RagB family
MYLSNNNMNNMKKIIITIAFLLMGSGFWSCTNLDEKVYSSIEAGNFFKNEEEVLMNEGRVYTYLISYCHYFNMWGTLTIASDEAICPFRETNLWWDNGVWVDLHRQDFASDLENTNNCWSFIFDGVSLCNQILYQLEESKVEFDTKPNLEAEVKIMRAWFYLNAIDLFGNVPIVTDFTDTQLPEQSSRKEVFDFVESEIQNNADLLQDYPTSSNYGRVTKAMAYAMLAKLYLNAQEWIGTPMWQETSDACDKVIGLGGLSIEPDYFTNFKVENQNSKENIFVIVYDNTYTSNSWGQKLIFHQVCLHTLSQQTYGIVDFCWDGFCAMESLYNSYSDTDKRKKMWLEGPQYDANGNPLMLSSTRQLTYRPSVKALYNPQDPALLDDGVRFAKYEYQSGLTGTMSNDYVIYRYADVLMMKGEALVRLNKQDDALPYFNEIRERAGMPDYSASDLTLDEILAERGREFAWEGLRRQDLIRFGKYTQAWFEKDAKDDHVKLMPIPYWAIDTNPNLQQNPGY